MAQVDCTLAGRDSVLLRGAGFVRVRLVAAVVALLVAGCSGDAGSEPATPSSTAATTASPSTAAPTSVPATVAPNTTVAATTVPPTTMPPAPAADQIVVDFYGSWSSGDLESALALVSPDVTSTWGAADDLADHMAYSVAVGQMRVPVECVVAANGPSSIVTCTVPVAGPVVDGLAIEAPRERHLVRDGMIVNITFSPAYAPAEQALSLAAMAGDPSGYEAACPVAPAPSAECGAFVRGFAGEAVALLPDLLPDEDADPIAVVAAFYEAWNAGDVVGASQYLSPDVVSEVGTEPGLGYHRLRNFMEFAANLPVAVSAGECELLGSGTNPAIVLCFVEYHSEVFDSMGIGGARVPHKVAGGVLTSVNVGAQYAVAEKALADFVAEAAGDEFATVCSDPEEGAGITYAEFGFSYNARCGAFVSQYVSDAAQVLSAG